MLDASAESRLESLRDLSQNAYSAFALGVILVFFVLAGLYESWSVPLSVILVVPLLSGLAGIALAGMDVNVFVQSGFVVLARDRQLAGVSIFDAAVEAAGVRLRPIMIRRFALSDELSVSFDERGQGGQRSAV